jgi:hypothetical protein
MGGQQNHGRKTPYYGSFSIDAAHDITGRDGDDIFAKFNLPELAARYYYHSESKYAWTALLWK